MNQPGSVLEHLTKKKNPALTPWIIWSHGEGASLLLEPAGGFAPRRSLMAVKRKRLQGYETLNSWWRRRLVLPLPCIPRHWSQRSHKWLLTLTVNGYKKTPSFLYITSSPLLVGFADNSRGVLRLTGDGWRLGCEETGDRGMRVLLWTEMHQNAHDGW